MDKAAHDRIVRLETLLETHLEKIVNGLDLLTVLKGETELNTKFRDEFRESVKQMIKAELSTIAFEGQIEGIAEKQIESLIKSDKFNSMIDDRAKSVVNKRLKDILLGGYVKISIAILGVVGALVTAVLKGWIGNG